MNAATGLIGDRLQPESRQFVSDSLPLQRQPLNLDSLHGATDLGDLASRLSDILTGYCDVHAEQSVRARRVNSTQFDCTGIA